MTTEIAILGAGSWGTALAVHLARIGHRVRLWSIEAAIVAEMRDRRANAVYLPDVLRYKQLLGLRRLFGKRFSYQQLEALRHVSPQAVARMKAGRLLSSELSSDDD